MFLDVNFNLQMRGSMTLLVAHTMLLQKFYIDLMLQRQMSGVLALLLISSYVAAAHFGPGLSLGFFELF